MAFANMLGGRDPMDMTDDEIRASLNEYYTRFVPAYCPGRRTKSKNFEGFLSGRLFLCLDSPYVSSVSKMFIYDLHVVSFFKPFFGLKKVFDW